MFVVLLTYVKPLAEIDRLMPSHVAFLEKCFRAGVFLVGGRQLPRTGGVIVATAASRADLEEVLSHDPFVVEEAVELEIVEFRSSIHHPALAPFADARTRRAREVPPWEPPG